METMRNWLRRWLGVDDLEDKLLAQAADVEFQHDRINHAYDSVKELQRLTERHTLEFNALFATLKSPVKQQLLQLKSGLTILTQFANELQREIEK